MNPYGRKHSPNISYYHYRVDYTQPSGDIVSKYYFTRKDICEELQTSEWTVVALMVGSKYKSSNPLFKNIKIYKDKQPAVQIVNNSNIYGILDET